MSATSPTAQIVLELAQAHGLAIGEQDAQDYADLIAALLPAYERVAELAAPESPATPSARRTYQLATPEDDPDHAWYVRTSIRTHVTGPLAGKRVALKDNVLLAGVPFLNGSQVYEGFIPDVDATVVTRILDAGGEISGKVHSEYLCMSGSSHTNCTGPTENAHRRGYSAGGSSSGSATAVANGDVQMSVGADQAGSIRMPSSWSGIVGLKPTWGLVPYTGIGTLETMIDHVGPMTATVEDNALLLEVIAGPDGYDGRQANVPTDPKYLDGLDRGVSGLRIGVVREGFGTAVSEPDVDEAVRRAVEVLVGLGAQAEDVSIPMHRDGIAIWSPVATDGLADTVLTGHGYGRSRPDHYPTTFMAWTRDHVDRLAAAPPNVKLFLLTSLFARRTHGFVAYGHAVNAARILRRRYDEALNRYDLLVMPTTPHKAKPHPSQGTWDIKESVAASASMMGNTAPFDVTHHPAMSVPVGFSDGLPIGMMLIARHFDEPTSYRAAYAYEQTGEGSCRR